MKRQRRLNGVDEIVLSLYAKGLTTGEISAHFADIYDASVSKETISRITDKVIDEMRDWSARPLDWVYAAIVIDAILVKVGDGQVANRPIYAAIGVSLDGCRDVLGLWAGTGGEGAKFWISVLSDVRNRGTEDVFFLVCDGHRRSPGRQLRGADLHSDSLTSRSRVNGCRLGPLVQDGRLHPYRGGYSHGYVGGNINAVISRRHRSAHRYRRTHGCLVA